MSTNGNGNAAPVSHMTDEQFQSLPLEAQVFHAWKASLYSQEQSRETRGEFEHVSYAVTRACTWAEQSSKHSDAARDVVKTLAGRVQTLESYTLAMKASLIAVAAQLHENRKSYDEVTARLEGRMLTEFANLTKRIIQAEEQAEEAEDWASKSGQREMAHLQERASKGDKLMEEIARRQMQQEDERRARELAWADAERKAQADHAAAERKADLEASVEKRKVAVKTWLAFSGAIVTIITAAGVVFVNSCGG